MNLCYCGCKTEIKENRKFVKGHCWKGRQHTIDTKNKLSVIAKGRIVTEEQKQRLRTLYKGRSHSEETKKKMSINRCGEKHPLYGKHHSVEACEKMSKSRKGKKITQETRLKMSIAFKGRVFSEEWRRKLSEFQKGEKHYFYGKKHTEEYKRKMSEACKGKITSEKSRNKMSQAMIQRIINNNGVNPGINSSKHGLFFSLKNNSNIHYDSSYELLAYQILEQLSKVKSYSRCRFSIDYEVNSSKHKYIPDILVTYDDNTKDVIEIKPEYKLNEGGVMAKFDAAKEYCKSNNMGFSIWTEKELKIGKYRRQ